MIALDALLWILDPIPRGSKVMEVFPYIEPCCYEFEINTPLREAAFIAQIAHETGRFRWLEELASGAAYEGRADLGNTEEGDGVVFKGRGCIQLTGRANYAAYSRFAYNDENYLLQYPQLVAEMPDAIRCAGWYWYNRKINYWADTGNFEKVTRLINGGLNGYDDRYYLYVRATQVIQ